MDFIRQAGGDFPRQSWEAWKGIDDKYTSPEDMGMENLSSSPVMRDVEIITIPYSGDESKEVIKVPVPLREVPGV